MENEKPKKTLTEKVKNVVIAISLIFFSLMFIAICSGPDEPEKPSKPKVQTHDKLDALIVSQDFVNDVLKSPATAKYGTDISSVQKVRGLPGKEEYMIRNYVDSENSYGAMLRTYYTCKITFNNDMVSCTDLNLEE